MNAISADNVPDADPDWGSSLVDGEWEHRVGHRMPALATYLDGGTASVPFGALVKARWRVREPLLADDEPKDDPSLRLQASRDAARLEHHFRERFVSREGIIIDEYYCPFAIGGGALTERTIATIKSGRQPRGLYSTLNSSDQRLLRLESQCHVLFDDASAVFGGSTRLRGNFDHCSTAVFALLASVLLAADTQMNPNATESQRQAALTAAELQQRQTDKRIRVSVNRQARFSYFIGVLIGTLAVLVLCAAIGEVVSNLWSSTVAVAPLVASTTFGALGALASVFQRLSTGKLVLDFTAPPAQRYLLGGLRPLVGAIFGAVVQFILVSGLILGQSAPAASTTTFGSFALIGFVAGFSERFATDMIEHAGNLLANTAADPPTSEVPTSATPVEIVSGDSPSPGHADELSQSSAVPLAAPESVAGDQREE